MSYMVFLFEVFPYESKVRRVRLIQDQDLVYQVSSPSIHKGYIDDKYQILAKDI